MAKVLIVDDSAMSRRILRRILEAMLKVCLIFSSRLGRLKEMHPMAASVLRS
jgi:chemotaxis response regulator CheB